MSAYYLVHTQTGLPPYEIKLYNQHGGCQGQTSNIPYAKIWVENWNKYNLAPTNYKPDEICSMGALVPKAKGNNPMYIDDACYNVPCTTSKKCGVQPQANAQSVIQVITDSKPDVSTDQREFLKRRVHDLQYVKYAEISEQFFKNEPHGPKTVDELKERLKKGHYTVEKPKYCDDDDEIYWSDAFSWRTPETQFDKVGYDAASKELSTFIQDILDQIAILDPKEGLALLDDLKKWKPSKAKK